MKRIDLNELKSVYESGFLTVPELAKHYGCTTRTIKNKLQRTDAVRRPFGWVPLKRPSPMVIESDFIQPEIRGDYLGYEFITNMLHGPLRKMYWEFYKGNRQDNITFNQILKLSGAERAKLLRANRELREMYIKHTPGEY